MNSSSPHLDSQPEGDHRSLMRSLILDGAFRPHDLAGFLQHVVLLQPLFNALPNTVFFVKDTRARYVLANQTLAQRCGVNDVESLLGKTSREVFNIRQGGDYTEQDFSVLNDGEHITDMLELHVYRSGDLGWCLTHKLPIHDHNNTIIAMAGVSIDILSDDRNHPRINERLEQTAAYMRRYFDQPIRMEALVEISGLSASQLERKFKQIFQTTPSQFIQKLRFEHAVSLLRQEHALTITEISARCGYTDHSAFSRHFKQLTGMSPKAFKEQHFRR